MKAIFVSGTDTGVGKTIITGCLARFFLGKGYNVITQKWVQTGVSGSSFFTDIDLHLKIMRRNKNDIKDYLAYMSPYTFKTACSPHLASKIENKKIKCSKIIKSFKLLSKEFDFVIVEGTGGALVPFSEKHLVIDIVKELGLGVLVVARNKLGTINHTLLTIEALKSRDINIFGIVINSIKKENKKIADDNPKIIEALSGEKILGVLPWAENYDRLYSSFVPAARRIEKSLING